MSENLVTGVLCAVAGVLAGKIFSILWSRRNSNGNGNGNGSRNLRAAREMADLTATVRSLLQRVADLETWRDDQAD